MQESLLAQPLSPSRPSPAKAPELPAFYRPELDALRFFAFLSVYVSHSLPRDASNYIRFHLPVSAAQIMSAFANACASGVQLFFLLSAFLITSLLLREKKARGEIHLKSFYVRRILRIWPLYFFALAIAAFWPFHQARMPLNYLLAYLLLAGNWMTVFYGAPGSFMSILWSVSIEEQFYLTWPLALRKCSRQMLVGIAIGLVVVANVTRVILARGVLTEHTVWPNTFAELDFIAFGILSAIFLKERMIRSRWARLALGTVGFFIFVASGHFSPGHSVAFVIFGYPVVALALLMLFISIYGLQVTFKPLIYLGKISYGLYVYHKLSLYLVALLLGGRTGNVFRYALYWFGSLALTILFASASYRWLESPFLRLKERFAYVKSRPV